MSIVSVTNFTYKMKYLIVCLFASVFAEDVKNHPMYKYRYQTEDVMKTSASEIPYHGYHFAEGGYYPRQYQPQFERFPKYQNFDRYRGDFYEPFFYPRGFVDRNVYSSEKKDKHGENFEKAHGEKGATGEHGRSGYNKEGVEIKDVKGDSGFYKDEEGFKKGYDDAKNYQGGGFYNKGGKVIKNKILHVNID